jgi:RES domain-containing protein
MTTAWRICQSRWAATAFSGAGAAEFSGRWNSPGRKVVYCASTRALAAMEILANVEEKSILRKASFVAIAVEIPDGLIFLPKTLPGDWRRTPVTPVPRKFGDKFLDRSRYPAMRVPSVVILGEFNFVLNPLQARFADLKIGRPEIFQFDPRVID